MKVINTNIEDVKIFQPKTFEDERGYFMETFRNDFISQETGRHINFCQDNESKSKKGTIRGLHYQMPPYTQTKLVRVISGKVLDIAVDIRKGSKSFGKYIAVELDSTLKQQLYIPRGFAHGFIVLSEEAIFSYKVDNYYNQKSERGIIYNDNFLSIDWKLEKELFKLSDKDILLPTFEKSEFFNIDKDLYR
ncbi:MAG TPA: dTDP-4-dehydrorhamnose 3,5-epimerase [Arcobacter sp.]|nr:dTDP-4-dehydrorhamnose 3,5-epimerase [Arcobacter sp.]